MEYGLHLRSGILFVAACAVLVSIATGMVALLGGKSDPLRAYRDAARTGTARAVVIEVGAAGVLVSYPDAQGGEVRAAVADFGLLGPGWRRTHPVGSSLDVVEVAGRSGSPVVPRELLDEVPEPDDPSPVPGLLAALAGVACGVGALRAARRLPAARWQGWFRVEAKQPTTARPAASWRGPQVRVVATPQGRAVRRKLGVGTLMLLAVPVLAFGAPTVVRTAAGALASRDWPTVPGLVVDSRLRPVSAGAGRDETYAYVVFAYEVDGRRYRASTPEWSINKGGWGSGAEDTVARYPRGARVPVHYDPAAPRRAVLRPGWDAAGMAGWCGVVGAMALGWLWGLRVLLRPLPPEAAPALPGSHSP